MSEPAERPGSADGYLSAFSGYHAPACPPSGLSVGATKARDGGEGEHSRDRGRPSIGDSRGSCPGHLVLASCPSGTDLSSSYFFRLFFFFFWNGVSTKASFLLDLSMGSSLSPTTALHRLAALRIIGGGKKGAGQRRLQDGPGAAEAAACSAVASMALAVASWMFLRSL